MHTILFGLVVFVFVVSDSLLDVPRREISPMARLASFAAVMLVFFVALNLVDGLPDTQVGPLFEHRDLDIWGIIVGFAAGLAAGRSARSALEARVGRKAAPDARQDGEDGPPAGGPPMGGAA